MAAMERVERLSVEIGTKQPAICPDVPKERQMEIVMDRLRNKTQHFKSWAENAKALRMALVDKRHVLDGAERSQLQKCLDTLQRSIKVTSLQSMVERLESISRQLGLKFTAGPSGTDCFISSDMFYVEVLLEATGTVKDVKIAHHGEPVSCPEISEVLSKWDFAEFTQHLEGLSAIYQLNADKKQKSKAYLALQALETDLTMLSQLQSSINDPCNLVHKSPVGILETRRGGHPMKLTYFISPYDLLDLDANTLMPLTVDAVIEKQLGYSVMVCIESSMAHKLQTQSLMSISRTSDGKSLPSFAAPSNLNSTTLPASFVLKLDSPMPIATALVRKIQAVTHIECVDLSTNQPLLSLITQRASKGELDCHNRGLFVTLPDQHHCYFLSGGSDLQGVMVSSIPFTHPTHVPQILIFLRQQALFNVLIGSCIRPNSKQDLESALMFEMSALSWLHITVAFEHPIEESMATAEFDLSDITNVKCKLHTMPNDTPICTDDYASKVIQRCLSIPVTMRALVRKAQGQQQQQRMNHTNGDMLINLVPNGSGNLLGHPSPFSEVGGGSKFVTDFDVKMNGRGNDSKTETSNSSKMDLPPSYGVATELNQTTLGLDTSSYLDVTPPSSASAHGDLFSIPPERAGSLTNPSPLGNVLSQAVSQQQSPSLQTISTPITHSQGKPNAMLMNLLHDFPQGMPMADDPQQGGTPRQTSPSASPPLPQYQGKPNAMLMNLLHEFPECLPMEGKGGAAAAQGTPKPRKQRKRKATTDATSPRSTTGRSPKRKVSEDDCSKDLPTPDVESNDSTFDISNTGQSGQLQSNFLVPALSGCESLLAKAAPLESYPGQSRDNASMVSVTSSDQCNTHAVTVAGSAESMHGTSSARLPADFKLKSEPLDFDVSILDSHPSGVGHESEEFSLEVCQNDTFTISGSAGSLIMASSSSDKLKEGKKAKKIKLELGHKGEEKDMPLGKEIEKIPIVLDIMSATDSKPAEIVRTCEPIDRRPSVEIIPLGNTGTAGAPVQSGAGMTLFNSGMKMPKSSGEGSKKDSKMKQRELRKEASEMFNRKIKIEGKKDRKRKRLEGVDGIRLEGGLKPPKIINVITPIPTSHSGVTCLDKSVSISHKPMDAPASRPATLNAKPPLTTTANSSISVSVTKTIMTPTTTKKSVIPSPNISPTLSISPNKTISILKTSQSNKPKIPLNKSASSSNAKASSSDGSSAKSLDSTKVIISPLKMPNKSKQGLTVKNGSQSPQGGPPSGKVSTKPATVKLKQLNLSTSSPSSSTFTSVPRNVTSPTISKSTTLTTALPSTLTSSIISSAMVSLANASTSMAGAPTNVASLSSKLQVSTSPSSSSQAANSAAMALLAAQKANKLALARKKTSLTAVIDKLMASSMQHMGDVVPPPVNKKDGTSKMDGVSEKRDLKGEKKDSQGGTFQKGSEARPSKSTFSDGKSSDTKKAEFTVKQSSQGIKLTVTKTHITEGGTRMFSSIKGSSAKSNSAKALAMSSSLSKMIAGSATGLKPGVNSGPASKKGVAPLGPQLKPATGQSKSISSSPKTLAPPIPSSSSSPSLPAAPHVSTASSSKNLTGLVNSVTKAVSKHTSGADVKPPPTSKPQEKTGKPGFSPKATSAISSASNMPPPPPPLADHAPSLKKSEDLGLRHSPIRQIAKLARDAAITDESETERAFQRLLQAQGNSMGAICNSSAIGAGAMGSCVSIANSICAIGGVGEATKASNGAVESANPVVIPLGGASKPDRPRTPKLELADKSPKHGASDGRNTPKLEKPSTPSPGLSSCIVIPKIIQMETKRPLTPKLDVLSKLENSVSAIQSPAESPSSSKGGTPKPIPKLKPSSSSPGSGKDSSSPEDSLVIDCPRTPRQTSPDRKGVSKPQLPSISVESISSQPKSSPDARMPISPAPIPQLKSPAQASSAIRSPAVANTPQSEHSNPSSVAHSSPYDIDDELMDEALVGLGK